MSKKTLVFGASLKVHNYSNLAISRLVENGISVVVFGVKEGNAAGVEIEAKLLDYENINTVTLYLNPFNQKEYYNYIISLKPKRIIFNPGTENLEFYKILDENKIYYEVACTLTLLALNQY